MCGVDEAGEAGVAEGFFGCTGGEGVMRLLDAARRLDALTVGFAVAQRGDMPRYYDLRNS